MYNSIYPLQIKPYVPPYVKKGTNKKEDEDAASNPSSGLNQDKYERTQRTPHSTEQNDKKSYTYGQQEFPNGQKTTIDYSKSQVNIAQILTDFKNTAIAIGSPVTIINEVDQYLSIAETESLKNEPNKKRIQSNLKNASNVLDEFISKTLNKKSKVVENWIEALFLQQVDYKSDPNTINPDFLVKLPDKETGDMKPISPNLSAKIAPQEETIPTQQQISLAPSSEPPAVSTPTQTTPQKDVYIPENKEVKSTLLQAKKYQAIGQEEKAIKIFLSAAEKAALVGDNKAEGIAYFEIGKIYDKNDELENALKYYHQARITSDDKNLKVKSYYNMAKIYDDVVYFEPALNHYFAAISFAGEADNLNAQTKAFSNIADMYAKKYDIENTYHYYDIAKDIAMQTNNNKTKGATWARSGNSLALLNENINAIKDYKTSIQFYQDTDSTTKMSQIYGKAADVMFRLGNNKKAQSLLKKSQLLALKANDENFKNEVEKRLGL